MWFYLSTFLEKYTHTHTHYLCQSDILLLNGVLQTVAKSSGQQQICRLADHIVHLCGAEKNTYIINTYISEENGRVCDCAEAISSISCRELLRPKASTNSLSEFLCLRLSPFGKKSKCQPTLTSTLPCYELSGSLKL